MRALPGKDKSLAALQNVTSAHKLDLHAGHTVPAVASEADPAFAAVRGAAPGK
jgi:hypothetical protein